MILAQTFDSIAAIAATLGIDGADGLMSKIREKLVENGMTPQRRARGGQEAKDEEMKPLKKPNMTPMVSFSQSQA